MISRSCGIVLEISGSSQLAGRAVMVKREKKQNSPDAGFRDITLEQRAAVNEALDAGAMVKQQGRRERELRGLREVYRAHATASAGIQAH